MHYSKAIILVWIIVLGREFCDLAVLAVSTHHHSQLSGYNTVVGKKGGDGGVWQV